MASVAFLEGYHYVPRIDKELLADHQEGLICLSRLRSASSASDPQGPDGRSGKARDWFPKLFGKNFYVEIQNNGLDIRGCAPKGPSTSPTRWACRWSPPATPTI